MFWTCKCCDCPKLIDEIFDEDFTEKTIWDVDAQDFIHTWDINSGTWTWDAPASPYSYGKATLSDTGQMTFHRELDKSYLVRVFVAANSLTVGQKIKIWFGDTHYLEYEITIINHAAKISFDGGTQYDYYLAASDLGGVNTILGFGVYENDDDDTTQIWLAGVNPAQYLIAEIPNKIPGKLGIGGEATNGDIIFTGVKVDRRETPKCSQIWGCPCYVTTEKTPCCLEVTIADVDPALARGNCGYCDEINNTYQLRNSGGSLSTCTWSGTTYTDTNHYTICHGCGNQLGLSTLVITLSKPEDNYILTATMSGNVGYGSNNTITWEKDLGTDEPKPMEDWDNLVLDWKEDQTVGNPYGCSGDGSTLTITIPKEPCPVATSSSLRPCGCYCFDDNVGPDLVLTIAGVPADPTCGYGIGCVGLNTDVHVGCVQCGTYEQPPFRFTIWDGSGNLVTETWGETLYSCVGHGGFAWVPGYPGGEYIPPCSYYTCNIYFYVEADTVYAHAAVLRSDSDGQSVASSQWRIAVGPNPINASALDGLVLPFYAADVGRGRSYNPCEWSGSTVTLTVVTP